MNLPSLPSLQDLEFEEEKKETESKKKQSKKRKPIIPKTEYDNQGNPILAIPDLDDVDLSNEIDRFFGEEDDK